jgi:osmotically-inducible protein OsmY
MHMKTDQQLHADVIDELSWEPLLKATGIEVGIHNGIVTLRGFVNFYSEKLAAERAVKRVRGVKAVAQHIEVRLTAGARIPDDQIAESVVKALEWSSTIPNDKIKIKVDNGWVHLEGKVGWLYQKEAAENAVSDLNGVRGVNNQIIVEPDAEGKIIKENIRKALERSANLEADKIHIEARGNKVTLKGSARSWNERREVERAAASAPGVAEIDDQLAIIY